MTLIIFSLSRTTIEEIVIWKILIFERALYKNILVNKYLRNIRTSRQTEFSWHWRNSTKSIFPIWNKI